jgi:exopolyphosphatase
MINGSSKTGFYVDSIDFLQSPIVEFSSDKVMEGGDTMPPLSLYLSRMRNVVFPRSFQASLTGSTSTPSRSTNGAVKPTLVMGNPSADLDSFVSAVVLSYFYNRQRKQTVYVPILNLPGVKASELWRLRPEFGVALRLAMGESVRQLQQPGKETSTCKVETLEQLVTIGDVQADQSSTLHALFEASDSAGAPSTNDRQTLFLVDHNAPSIPGLSEETIDARFEVVGCVDHHVDEGYTPPNANPRIVTTGIGSCTSLVVRHLRDEGMWPAAAAAATQSDATASDGPEANDYSSGRRAAVQQMARLALAPILIDTANLQATGDKCSDTDREAVGFLEAFLVGGDVRSQTTGGWDRDAFHHAIGRTKADSLNLLDTQEIFARDYKVWSEPTKATRQNLVNIGISSLVKPLSWLVEHAGGIEKFLDEIDTFATGNDLGVFAMLTRAGDRKEVVVLGFDGRLKGLIEEFEAKAPELKLDGTWHEDEDLSKALSRRYDKANGKKAEWKIWWMGDTSKSRKQVGPLLREAVNNL